jgi:FOG: CheY-like receiver
MNLSRLPKNLVVLVAEANDAERRRLEALFPSLAARFRIVRDGEEVVDYLCSHSPFLAHDVYPFPDLLVMNLQMPRMNGFELLRWLARSSDCASLPKIILDRAYGSRDVEEAYRLGANTVFTRPVDTAELSEALGIITHYWAKAELPFVRHC